MHRGICAICLNNTELTKEHIPVGQKSAATSFKVNAHHPLVNGQPNLQKRIFQDGFYKRTLCKWCNNRTGHQYGAAYIDFAKQLDGIAQNQNEGEDARFTVQIRPLNVAKQALSMFCATSGADLATHCPLVSELILSLKRQARYEDLYLDSQKTLIPQRFRIMLYLMCKDEARSSGFAQIRKHSRHHALSEVSFYPAGWVIDFNGFDEVIGMDVTDWLIRYSFDEEAELDLRLPSVSLPDYAEARPLIFRNTPDRGKSTVLLYSR